jgi:hypothetical protein
VTPAEVLALSVRPVLAWMGPPFASPEAEVMLLAVAMQESGCRARRQENGPARGLWQFESGPGSALDGLIANGRTADRYLALVSAFDLPGYPRWEVHGALEHNDQLACALARLLLWSHHAPLPEVGHEAAAWHQYLALWRPGRPRPDDWSASYAAALAGVRDGASWWPRPLYRPSLSPERHSMTTAKDTAAAAALPMPGRPEP